MGRNFEPPYFAEDDYSNNELDWLDKLYNPLSNQSAQSSYGVKATL